MLQRRISTQTCLLLIALGLLWFPCSWCGFSQGDLNGERLDLTVENAVQEALAAHPEIAEAQLLLQVAELELDAEKAALLVPEIDMRIVPPDLTSEGLSGSLEGTVSGSLTLPIATSGVLSSSIGFLWDPDADELQWGTWAFTLSGKLDPLNLAAGVAQLQRKGDGVDDAQRTLVQIRNDVLIETIDAYASLAMEQSRVTQAEEDLAEAERAYDQAIIDREAGWIGQSELLQIRLRLFDAEIELDELSSALTERQGSFCREYLGLELGNDVELSLAPILDAIDLDLVLRAAEALVQEDARILAAIETFPSVVSADQAVAEAEESLNEERYGVLPTAAVSARWNETGWQIGGEISIDLVSPKRHAVIEIAEIELNLAEKRAETARTDAENNILSKRDTLAQALQTLDRLGIERQRWTLEAEIAELQHTAGLLSEDEWNDFLADQKEFFENAEMRQIDVLTGVLDFLDMLGVDLERTWEEWLR
ncbi:TolC family protein [Candidatus Bipolaricaulota bacterium]|nr:TolC family protein [Candidatus Bipolaricaulota bacterium]